MEPFSEEYWIEKLKVPEDVVPLLMTPPSLLPGENLEHYYQLIEGMVFDLAPEQTIEWMWVVELGVLWFEIMRLRRLKQALIPIARADVLDQVLAKTHPDAGIPGHNNIVRAKVREERQVLMQNPTDAGLNARLIKYGYNRDALHALALDKNSAPLGFVEKMLAAARKEVRAITREMKHYRSFLDRVRDAEDRLLEQHRERVESFAQEQEKANKPGKDQE